MKLLHHIALILTAAALLAVASAEATELTPHRAQYHVKISILSGQLNTELVATANGYVATHVIKPKGLAKLHGGRMDVRSEFTAAADGVRPVRFHEIDTIRNDPETRIQFDWSTNQASGTVGDKNVLLQLDGIAYDNVSIQYELMHDLLNGEPSDTYVLFDVDKMRIANVRNIGTREIRTRAGTYKAVGIQHQKEGSSRVTTLWCAPELDYLPVVIEQHRKGKLNFQAALTSYSPT